MSTGAPKLLTPSELAAMLHIKVATMLAWHTRGNLPKALRLGPKTLRWREPDIAAWLERESAINA